jgi:NADPH:quinone reductase-like Zn-dependent oxidoreductase
LRVIGSTLRALPLARKAELCRDFAERVLPLFGSGQLRPMIDRVLPLAEAGAAHRALDSHHVGKIVLAL